jgi:asparagine synthase (glutamine-hydrolysing)
MNVNSALAIALGGIWGGSLLLSGGLDTSIIAHVVSQERKIRCYTVFFPYGRTPDIYYARLTARKLGPECNAKLPVSRLQERLADTIRILKTFDPMEIRNSVAVFHGLSLAHSEGFTKVMTGDAADELFAGYSFTFNLEQAEMMGKLRELCQVMHFSSQPMANALGIAASLPYLDQKVLEFAGLVHNCIVIQSLLPSAGLLSASCR